MCAVERWQNNLNASNGCSGRVGAQGGMSGLSTIVESTCSPGAILQLRGLIAAGIAADSQPSWRGNRREWISATRSNHLRNGSRPARRRGLYSRPTGRRTRFADRAAPSARVVAASGRNTTRRRPSAARRRFATSCAASVDQAHRLRGASAACCSRRACAPRRRLPWPMTRHRPTARTQKSAKQTQNARPARPSQEGARVQRASSVPANLRSVR
jgi:hypothetical protein